MDLSFFFFRSQTLLATEHGRAAKHSLSTVYGKFFFDFNLEFWLIRGQLVRIRWMRYLSHAKHFKIN